MATRESMEDFLQQCEDTIRLAQKHYEDGRKQQHFDKDGYTAALQQLETTYNDLAHLAHSANAQQREQLHRKRLQIQQLQNDMILLREEQPLNEKTF
ncbi:DUF2524 domain-containing protein [Bacillus methanolicus]|uniref:YtzC family protein n=1 Tax=Bacillus methanolicus TaxID=1471 RepID=UPI0023800A43|nr:YtzC family protein [Bacillus methanolicus]MDE3839973.1 DUF2524 domain-containing protein [Bacillus methanolicus]